MIRHRREKDKGEKEGDSAWGEKKHYMGVYITGESVIRGEMTGENERVKEKQSE